VPFTFHTTALVDVILIEPQTYGDDRGVFRETFKASDFADAGLPTTFAQNNLSTSKVGVLRGLHFQTDPMAQGKLVGCASGAVFDVAVDLRHGSPSFGQWIGEELSLANGNLLWIPAGFAHGFCTLADNSVLTYATTEVYSGPHDGGIAWDDPDIGVEWPITAPPQLSDKDRSLPRLREKDPGFSYQS
jgi:dTDP-4-dehydrorhamnose 3,5-epimerase